MQTNNSGLGKEFEQRRDLKINIQEVNPAVFEDSGVAGYYANLHPKYSGFNSVVFRNKMLTDARFREQYINDYVEFISGDERVQQLRENDPEAFQEKLNSFKSGMINNLSFDTRQGQSIPDAIIDRDRNLRTTQGAFDFNSKRIKSIVNANKEAYKELGIIDAQGNMLYDTPALKDLIASDQDLQSRLLQDNYNAFLDALSKSHNEGSIDDSNIHSLAQAYAVYNNFGQEGLTHFANLQQHYQNGVAYEQQDQRVRQALTYMTRSRSNGLSPFQHMDKFLGSAEDEDNMIWQPEQTSLDMGKDLPLDLNRFTSYRHNAQDSVDYIRSLTSAVIRGESRNMRDLLSNEHLARTGQYANMEQISNNEEFLNDVAFDLLNDLDSRESRLFAIDLFRYARSGEGTFTLDDVVNTVVSNANNFTYDPRTGATNFHLDYEQADVQTRLALRILEKDVAGHALGLSLNDGIYTFEPKYRERVQQRFNATTGILSPTWASQQAVVETEDGQQIVMDVPDTSILGQVANLLPAIGWTTGQFINDYLVRPTSSFTANVLNNVGLENLTKRVSDSSFATWIREAGDFDMYEDSRGVLPQIGMVGTELAGYIAGSMYLGKKTIATGGAAAGFAAARMSASTARLHRTFTSMSQARSMGVAASTLKGPNKFKSALDKIKNTSPTNRWMFFPRIEIGAVGMEVLGGQRRSLYYHEGLQDIINNIAGSDIDVQSKYLASDRLTQIGMDAVTSLAIGTIADNVIGAIKYAGRFRGKPQRGLRVNKEGTDYIKVAAEDIPFAPDWRRAWYNLTNGLQEMPIGTIADSKANEFIGRAILSKPESVRTLADVVTIFKNNTSDILKNIRDEIETSIREYDREFGRDIRLSEDDILARRDRIYGEALDNIARTIEEMFDVRSVENGVPMNLLFADMLSELAPTTRRLDYQRPDGTFKTLLNKTEAATLQAENPGSVLRRVGNAYQVYEVDPNHWTAQVSAQMRQAYADADVSEVVSRRARAEGIDVQGEKTQAQIDRLQQISFETENVLGRPLVANGKLGRVIDFDDSGYTVLTRDGQIERNVQSRQLDAARAAGNYDRLPPFLERRSSHLLPERTESGRVEQIFDAQVAAERNRQRDITILNGYREDAAREYVEALRMGSPGAMARARARLQGLGVADIGDIADIPAVRQVRVEAEQQYLTAYRTMDEVGMQRAANTLRELGVDDASIQQLPNRTTRPSALLPEMTDTGIERGNIAIGLRNFDEALASQDIVRINQAEQALRDLGLTDQQIAEVRNNTRRIAGELPGQTETTTARINLVDGLRQHEQAVLSGDAAAVRQSEQALRNLGVTEEQLYQVNLRLRSSQVDQTIGRFKRASAEGDITDAMEQRAALKGYGLSDENIDSFLPPQQRRLPARGTITDDTYRQGLIERNLSEAIDRINADKTPEAALRTLRGLDADPDMVRQRIFDATQKPIDATRKEADRVQATYKEGTRKDTKLAELQRDLDIFESDQRRALRQVDDIYAESGANQQVADSIAKNVIESSRTAAKLAQAPEGRVIVGPNDDSLNKFGISAPMKASIVGPLATMTKALARKIGMVFGVSSNQHYYALGKNISEIAEWMPKKSVSKGTIVKHNGVHYMARQTVPAGEHVPSQWVVADNNTLTFNKYWAKLDINETIDGSGRMTRFVRDTDEYGTFYRPAQGMQGSVRADDAKELYLLNIQKPVSKQDISFEQIIANDIDAIVIDPVRQHYRILHNDQAVRLDQFDRARTTDFSGQQYANKFRGDC